MSIEQMRAHLAALYASPAWKEKVRRMPDKQVLAFYFKSIGR